MQTKSFYKLTMIFEARLQNPEFVQQLLGSMKINEMSLGFTSTVHVTGVAVSFTMGSTP